MADDWANTTLGACCAFVNEKADPSTVPPDTPYIGLEHLQASQPNIVSTGRACDVTSLVSWFESGDTLFGRLRPYLRKVALAKSTGVCSPEVLVLRAQSTQVLPEYLFLLASSDTAIDQAVQLSAGSRMPRTSVADLASLPVRLPPLPLQWRIVELAAHLDDHLVNLRREIESIESLWVQVARRVWDVSSQTGTMTTLDAVSSRVKNGVMYRRGSGEGGLPITRIESVSSGEIELLRTGRNGFDEATHAEFLLEAGDILFSHKNSVERVGTTALVKPEHLPLVNGDNILQIRPANGVVAGYLFALLRSTQCREYIRAITKPAVNQASVNTAQVKGIPIPIVPRADQLCFAEAFMAVEQLLGHLRIETSRFSALRGALLGGLVSGTVEIARGYDDFLNGVA